AQPARFRHIHAAVAATPVIESRIRNTVLAAKVRNLHPGVGFLQHPDYLFFREPRLLHDKVSLAALPLTLPWNTSEGKGHCATGMTLHTCSTSRPNGCGNTITSAPTWVLAA